ncbi:hypothetical protein TL16_g01354 [Triparma laevis f. inornata]|uniref:Myb-like domain-containing protein n=1 Tax=Triparma laevis f. inornata TaxID=1714386 RepID=A0A9W6ZML6_9STRA|nr:hypothetical protein TL16_g01354 [Triparma laevis f. inornata]
MEKSPDGLWSLSLRRPSRRVVHEYERCGGAGMSRALVISPNPLKKPTATAAGVAMGDGWRRVPVTGDGHYRYDGPAGEWFTSRSAAKAAGMSRTLGEAGRYPSWTEEEEVALGEAVGEHGEDFDRIKAESGTTFGERTAGALEERFRLITKAAQRHEEDDMDTDDADEELDANCPACNGSHSRHVCGKGGSLPRVRGGVNKENVLKAQEAKGELGWFEAQLAQAGVDMGREIRVGRARLEPLKLIEDATATSVAMGDGWRKVPMDAGNGHYRYECPAGEWFTNRSNAEAAGMPRTLARAGAPAIEQQERGEEDNEDDEYEDGDEDEDALEAEVVTTKKRKRKEKTVGKRWTEEEDATLAEAIDDYGLVVDDFDFDRLKAESGTTFGERTSGALKSRFLLITKAKRYEQLESDTDEDEDDMHESWIKKKKARKLAALYKKKFRRNDALCKTCDNKRGGLGIFCDLCFEVETGEKIDSGFFKSSWTCLKNNEEKSGRKCGMCNEVGHNKRRCPKNNTPKKTSNTPLISGQIVDALCDGAKFEAKIVSYSEKGDKYEVYFVVDQTTSCVPAPDVFAIETNDTPDLLDTLDEITTTTTTTTTKKKKLALQQGEDWSRVEDNIVFEAQLVFGNNFDEIAKLLPSRTKIAVRRRFYNSTAHNTWLNKQGMEKQLTKTTGVVMNPNPYEIKRLHKLTEAL